MILRLKEIFDVEGSEKSVNSVIEIEEMSSYNTYEFITPVTAEGKITNRSGIVKLTLTVNFVLKHICDRCLVEFEQGYSFNFNHLLARSLNKENDDYVVCEENKLDLNSLIISDLLLQLPTKILCKEDCKGLCCICGTNRNISECTCSDSKL